jgi:hypothetical protein
LHRRQPLPFDILEKIIARFDGGIDGRRVDAELAISADATFIRSGSERDNARNENNNDWTKHSRPLRKQFGLDYVERVKT